MSVVYIVYNKHFERDIVYHFKFCLGSCMRVEPAGVPHDPRVNMQELAPLVNLFAREFRSRLNAFCLFL